MTAPIRVTLLSIVIAYVATQKYSAVDPSAPEVIPGPRFPQHTPPLAIIVPEGKYNSSTDNGFKPLTKAENEYVQEICGQSVESYARVRNGHSARRYQFPWAIDLSGRCSGVLISPRHVLTAAHCFYSKKFEDYSKYPCAPRNVEEIGKGLFSLGYDGTCKKKSPECPYGINMKKAFYNRVIYPQAYQRHCSHDNDLAVILLKEDIQFDEFVRPICLANIHPKNLVQLKNIGFGGTPNLQYIDSKLVKFTDREIAIQGIRNDQGKEEGTINGDSGGPLQATFYGSNRTYLAGIMSRGWGSRSTSAYVPAYADWICTLTGVCGIE